MICRRMSLYSYRITRSRDIYPLHRLRQTIVKGMSFFTARLHGVGRDGKVVFEGGDGGLRRDFAM